MSYGFNGHNDEPENGYSYDLVHGEKGTVEASGSLYERGGKYYIRIFNSLSHPELIGTEVSYDFMKIFCWVMKSDRQPVNQINN